MVSRYGWLAAAMLMSLAATARAADPVKIGVISPLTGTAALYGQQQNWGVQLALEDANKAGGVLGRPVVAAFEDDRCNPAEGVKATQRLINEEKVATILGPICSSSMLATMPIAQRSRVSVMTVTASSDDIVNRSGIGGNEFSFKASPADGDLARGVIGFIKSQGVRSVAIIGEDTDFGRGGAKLFTDGLAGTGIAIVASEFFPQGTPDFVSLVTKMKAVHPDRIAGYFIGGDIANFTRQSEQSGVGIPFTGRIDLAIAVSAASKAFLEKGALNGSSGSLFYSPAVDSSENRAFVAKFRAKFHEDPTQHGFYGYEGTQILLDAIRRAGSTDPREVQKALKATKLHSILGGDYEFDDHNHAHNNGVVTEIRDGKVVMVSLFKS